MSKKIIITALVLLSFSSCGNGDEPSAEIQPESVSVTAVEDSVVDSASAETETVKTEERQTTAAASVTTERQITETSASVSVSETAADTTIAETVSETALETENLSEERAAVYTDKKSGKTFIIVNVTPRKIYWNDIEDYDIEVGKPMDIPVPAVFEDWFSGADEMMIYMDSSCRTFGSVIFDGEKMQGMTYPQYWSADYLCPIIGGTVHFGEYTEEMRSAFSRIDDGVYIEEANYSYAENPFADNMSVENLDLYFETIKSDSDALKKMIAENPDTDYDIAGFWGYQSGLRFRAEINFIN